MIRRIVQLAILTAVLTTNAADNLPLYRSVLIDTIPHVFQKKDFCGEATAEMYLRSLGENIDQDYIFDRARVNPLEGRGLEADELARSLTEIGFHVGPIWSPLHSEEDLASQFDALHSDLLNGVPSIVCMHTSETNEDEHFRLILGYDAKRDQIVYHEPAMKNGSYQKMQREQFLSLWPIEGAYETGAIRIRLDAKEVEYGDTSEELTSADYAQHIMELKGKTPAGFTTVIEKPFVIISDTAPEEVDDYASRIVRRAVDLLKKDYFLRDPKKIIDIWLFKDEPSYQFHSAMIFGHDPETPFGYYSEEHSSLIIDISTGGGTLVHEIVHPFFHSNFPTAPAWFNEGVASLFERPTKHNGHIHGLINWRLPSLKKSINDGNVPSIEWLAAQSDEEFYGKDPGTNYAQSRYLCYYLQQKGLLIDYYHALYENRRRDRTGISTLKNLLEINDMGKFQNEWENWVLDLVRPDNG